ncbi:uncharacterized protein [Littorina saxatilis]|uniref:Uncharacterized protein n=1 Tax=Littorina saxatilis TaxID=31220 RepID=A0AAN9BGW3_9CAEN
MPPLCLLVFALQLAILACTESLICSDGSHSSPLSAGFLVASVGLLLISVLAPSRSRLHNHATRYQDSDNESTTSEDDETRFAGPMDSVDGQQRLDRMTEDYSEHGFGTSGLRKTGRHPGRETLRRHTVHVVNREVSKPSLHDVYPKPADFYDGSPAPKP